MGPNERKRPRSAGTPTRSRRAAQQGRYAKLERENEALRLQVREALEQQTATSEILRVISASPTDVQPVFDSIVRSAVRLCDARFALVFRREGEVIHLVSHHNYPAEALEQFQRTFSHRLSEGRTVVAQAMLRGAVVHIHDILLNEDVSEAVRELARSANYRSVLAVPMMREGRALGAIAVARSDPTGGPKPFSVEEIDLLKTFTEQAVIAIENVRLFEEVQTRTAQLTRSVEELKALGEVSRAVSSTLEVETVLNMIVSRSSQLAGADRCSIYEFDESAGQFDLCATHPHDAEFIQVLRAAPLRKGEGLVGRAAETREPVQIADITRPGAYQSSIRDMLIGFGYRALLGWRAKWGLARPSRSRCRWRSTSDLTRSGDTDHAGKAQGQGRRRHGRGVTRARGRQRQGRGHPLRP